MVEENVRQEFRLKNVDETRNYFVKEKDKNKLMSKKLITSLHDSKLL